MKAKASVAQPVKAAASEPAVVTRQIRWEVWALVVAILLAFFAAYWFSRPADKIAPIEASNETNSGSSGLRVVPGEDGGTSSSQASGALQPQATGLQQSQPTAQSASGLNLQAQTSPQQ